MSFKVSPHSIGLEIHTASQKREVKQTIDGSALACSPIAFVAARITPTKKIDLSTQLHLAPRITDSEIDELSIQANKQILLRSLVFLLANFLESATL